MGAVLLPAFTVARGDRLYVRRQEPLLADGADAAEAGAVFSADGRYRWVLWRVWAAAGPLLNAICCNPSTANERRLDPTCRLLKARAKAAGCRGLVVTNIFGLVSTDPAALRRVQHPIGARNDRYILEQARACDLRLAAWGAHGAYLDRGREVAKLLADRPLLCLAALDGGQPRHPLYWAASRPWVAWPGFAEAA